MIPKGTVLFGSILASKMLPNRTVPFGIIFAHLASVFFVFKVAAGEAFGVGAELGGAEVD